MQNNALKTMFRLANHMKHLTFQIVIAVVFAVGGFICSVAIPTYLVYLLFVGTPTIKHLMILLIIATLRGLMRYGEHYFGHYVAFRVLADFRKIIYEKLAQLSPSKLDTHQKGSLLKMIGEDIEALEIFFAHTLAPLTTATIVCGILLVYFGTLSIYLAVIALVCYILLAIVLPVRFASELKPLLAHQNHVRTSYYASFMECLHGIVELIQYQKIKNQFSELNKKSQDVNLAERKISHTQLLQTASSFFVIGVSILLFSLIAFRLNNSFQAISAIVVFSGSFAPFLELSRLPLGLRKSINAANDIFVLLDEQPLIVSGNEPLHHFSDIKMNNVYFKYPNRSDNVLHDLSVSFSDNKIIGIIGKSGSGKSTLMKLLMKWYDFDGEITIGKNSLKHTKVSDIQKHFAYIPQYPKIFNTTLRENLTLGKKIADEKILAACQQCNILERINSLPEKLDTLMNTESKIFSSGELQRLELVRAILKDAQWYIFDEPTSNLDSINEAIILNIIKYQLHKPCFLITHRESSLAIVDEIYAFVDGKIYKK